MSFPGVFHVSNPMYPKSTHLVEALFYRVVQINQVIMNIQLLSGSTEPERLGRNRGQAALNS